MHADHDPPPDRTCTECHAQFSTTDLSKPIPGESHLETLQHYWLKVEDLRVQVNGTQGSRCDDDALELAKHWLNC